MEFKTRVTNTGTYHEDQFGNLITTSGRPSGLIDQKKKGKEWILANIKSIYVDYNRYFPNMFFNNRLQWDENILYFQGLIDPGKYIQRADQNKAETKNVASVNYDKRFLNVLSKYVRILLGKLSEVQFSITATPVNPLARQHMKEYKAKIQAATQIKLLAEQLDNPDLLQVLADAGFDDLPADDIEEQIKMTESLPYQAAMNIESYLKYISYLNGLDQKLTEGDLDLISCGVVAVEECYDANGNPMSERVDPRSLLVGWSNNEDFRDNQEVGKFRMITMNELVQEDVNGDLADCYSEIEQFNVGRYGNQVLWNPYSQGAGFRNMDYVYAKNRILVLDVYFYSYDEDTYVAKNDRNGNRRVDKMAFGYYSGRSNNGPKEEDFKKNNPDKELYRTRTKNIYKGTWLVGTDYIYNYGLYRNMARTKSDPVDTKLPILIQAPLMRNGKSASILEEIKVIADAANLTWQQMQNATAHARPPGFEFNTDALFEATKGLGAHGYDFEKVMENMLIHNIIPMSTKNLAGVNSGARPFQEIEGGLGSSFGQWAESLKFYLYMLQEITGFSSVAAGSNVQYTGKEVANLAIDTADYSIKHLFSAKKYLYQDLMNLKAMMGMDSIAEGRAQGIRTGLGGVYEFFEIHKDTSLYDYAIMVEFKPTAQEWQEFNQMIAQAIATPLDQGGITLSDAGRIKECETIKQANAYLYVAIRKNMREAQAAQLQMQQTKAQQDQQTAQLSQQAQVAQLQMNEASQIRIIQATENEKRITEKQKFEYQMQIKKLEGLVKTDQLQRQGQIDANITDKKVMGNIDRVKTNTLQVGS